MDKDPESFQITKKSGSTASHIHPSGGSYASPLSSIPNRFNLRWYHTVYSSVGKLIRPSSHLYWTVTVSLAS